MRSVPFNKSLSPQNTDSGTYSVNVTAEFMVGDANALCDSEPVIADEGSGRVLFLMTETAVVECPASGMYYRLQAKGAVALIVIVPNGYTVSDPFDFYSRDRDKPYYANVLSRLNRWILCLSIYMIVFVAFLPIGATSFLYVHTVGWVVCWSGAGIRLARLPALVALCCPSRRQ